jgi:lipoate-protein ligase A
MTTARVIEYESAAGAWNMAVDEVLLDDAGATGNVYLRFYGWSEPTLSLGYFQRHADRESHQPSRDCSMVRRATGGGAILHDRELTYSFVAPIADRVSADVQKLYRTFHQSLIDTFSTWGIHVTLCNAAIKLATDVEPFLCFQRRTDGDLLVESAKIVGSAQRRHKGAVLQHGSILLSASPCAPELLGVKELTGIAINARELVERWLPLLCQQIDIRPEMVSLTDRQMESAKSHQSAKFACDGWTKRR